MTGKRSRLSAAGDTALPGGGDGGGNDGGNGAFVALHRSRMFEWAPASVAAMSSCPGGQLLAVGYESGDLELWDLSVMACIQRVAGEGIEVTCLAWARDSFDRSWRTFAAHLDGTISEVSWRSGCLTGTLDSAGGVVWCLVGQPLDAVKPGFSHILAAACDDGTVRLFGVEGGEPGAQLERTLAVLQGRLLSCAWHPSGDALAVGGVDGAIHVLDATTGHELVRVTAGSSSASPPRLWCLLVLADGTIVSGDSDGAVQMWDGSFGTQLARFQRHKADVLALAASPDGTSVFAAGVDSQVALFSPVEPTGAGGGGAPWAYLDYKRPHTHDVKAMAVALLPGGRALLVSGGADAQLVAYSVSGFLREHPARLSKAPQPPATALAAPDADDGDGGDDAPPPTLLCAQAGCLDVWQLGAHAPLAPAAATQQHAAPAPLVTSSVAAASLDKAAGRAARRGASGTATTATASAAAAAAAAASAAAESAAAAGPAPIEGAAVDLQAAPRHLARIQLGGGARVAAAAVSPGARFVACCSGRGPARLYRLTRGTVMGGTVSVSRVGLPVGLPRAVALALSSTHLCCAHPDGSVSVLSLPQHASDADGVPGGSEVASLVARASAADVVGSAADRTSGPAAGGSGSDGAATAASASEVQLLPWRQYSTPVSCLAVSPDGRTLAAAGAGGLALLRLPVSVPAGGPDASAAGTGPGSSAAAVVVAPLARAGKLLRSHHDAPVAGLAFGGPGGKLLAAALSSGHLALYDVAASRPAPWCLDHDTGIARCLEKLPGAPAGVSFRPAAHDDGSGDGSDAPPCLVVYGPGGFCHFDTSRAPDTAHLDAKRRRSKALPPPRDSVAARGDAKGRNGRAVLLPDPCVYAGYLSHRSLLVLEKPWEDVASGFAPPLLRHRYGG